MTDWVAFLGVTAVVVVLLLVLTHLTAKTLRDPHVWGNERVHEPYGVVPEEGRDETSTSRETPVRSGADELRASDHPDDRGQGNTAVDHPPSETGEIEVASRDEGDESSRDEVGVVADCTSGDASCESLGEQTPTDGEDHTDGGVGTTQSPTHEPECSDRARALTAHGRGDNAGTLESNGEQIPVDIIREQVSYRALLANVAISQGLFLGVLVGAAVYTNVPGWALGLVADAAFVIDGIVIGTTLGLALYVANEIGAALAKRYGIGHDEALRELLAPNTPGGWISLIVLVLPLIAVFEEFLFRAALIGVPMAGFDISPWLLVVVSSVIFAVGHGIQGAAGIVVTGLLGLVLGVAFVLTGSLIVVIVAHYVVNVLEFVVHEGLDLEWTSTLAG